MKKVVVYTVIIGDYDELKKPKFTDDRIEYICFTDRLDLSDDFWRIKVIKSELLDKTLMNREIKILPHRYLSDYEISLYIDGNIDICGNIFDLIDGYLENNLAVFKHPERTCIYEEALTCIQLNKDVPIKIKNQMNKYKNDNYPEQNGLIHGCIILRRHNDEDIIKLMESWWNEVNKESKRDQLSFNYVAWKHSFTYGLLPGDIMNNSYFCSRLHKHHNLNFNGKVIYFLTYRLKNNTARKLAKHLVWCKNKFFNSKIK